MSDPEELAQDLYRKADPTGIWAAEDECTRLHWRRQAQQQMTAERYKKSPESL